MIHWLRKASKTELRGVALLRLDFNTEDDWRMEAAIPTIQFLQARAEKVVIISHKGRPNGTEAKLSLRKHAAQLSRYLKHPVTFVSTLDFGEMKAKIAKAAAGSIFLLENLRFHAGEAADDPKFASQLAGLADYYVNDAFAVCHRAAASIESITRFLPAFGGLGLEKEIAVLSKIIEQPKQPMVVILGGGKAHDKLGVIRYLNHEGTTFLTGGAAANTFLKIKGVAVGSSLVDADVADYAALNSIAVYPNLVLPVDWETEKDSILDIGPKSIELFTRYIAKAKTIIWSGPVGYIEKKKFANGTIGIANAIVANKRATKIVGGGETVMFLKKQKLDSKFTFVSTGGGALLDYLAGEQLPGIVALEK